MAKYEYKRLYKNNYTQGGSYSWFFGNEQLDEKYKNALVFEILNELGEDGWQLVLEENKANYIMMKQK